MLLLPSNFFEGEERWVITVYNINYIDVIHYTQKIYFNIITLIFILKCRIYPWWKIEN